MKFFVFLTAALLIVGLAIWMEHSNKAWRALADSYGAPWVSHHWADNHSIHVWLGGDIKRTWVNGMHIMPSEDGLQFHPPWIKRWYFRSINIPLAELKLGSESAGMPRKLVLEVSSPGVFLAIPNSFAESIRFQSPVEPSAEEAPHS